MDRPLYKARLKDLRELQAVSVRRGDMAKAKRVKKTFCFLKIRLYQKFGLTLYHEGVKLQLCNS